MKGVNAYKRTAVTTSDPMDILVALYDGFLRHCKAAQNAMREGNRGKAGESLSKAIAIVTELQACIDSRQSPEFGENLGALYSYISQQLLRASWRGEERPIAEVVPMMQELRDAWAEAAVQLRTEARKAS